MSNIHEMLRQFEKWKERALGLDILSERQRQFETVPELLKALELALPLLKTYDRGYWAEVAEVADRAIAKAKGTT